MIKVNDYFGLGDEAVTLEVAAKLLDISDAEITIIKNDEMLNQVGCKDYVVNGLLHKTNIPGNHYNIYLRKDTNEPLRSTLCHEMLHLRQYVDGDLIVDIEHKRFIWKGKDYPYSYPYMQRPWEQEAFRSQTKFISEVRKALHKPTCHLFDWLTRKKTKTKA